MERCILTIKDEILDEEEEQSGDQLYKKKGESSMTSMHVETLVKGGSRERLSNIMYVTSQNDDSSLYCVECVKEYKGDCPVHGSLVVKNMKVESNDPDRARHSLPTNLLVRESNMDGAGLGVFTDTEILPGSTYGPYEGMYITDPELANSSDYCWQIYKDGAPSHFVDATDTASSNWMRYVNCAPSESDQNLMAFQYKGEIYYRCIKPILQKTELLVWYGGDCAKKFGTFDDKDDLINTNGNNIDDTGQASETEVSSLMCRFCHKVFEKKSRLVTHIRSHTGERPFKCQECGKAFSTNSYLNTHMRIHTGVKPFKCSVCDKEFNRVSNLNKHIMIHTGYKPHKCEFCVKAFKTGDALTIHMRTHTGEKPYKCEVCGKEFNTSSNFRKHMLIHTGEKPYKCTICEKAYKTNCSLSIHIRTHTGEKPYKCEICDKEFNTVSNLKTHVMIHSGEKPFKCKFCGKDFGTNAYLTIHMRRHTGEKPYECKICGMLFNRHSTLHKHKTMHHAAVSILTSDTSLESSLKDDSNDVLHDNIV